MAPQLTNKQLREFCARHQLPATFEHIAKQHFLPLASRLAEACPPDRSMLLGINGAQGTGKSTLADFLATACGVQFGWNVAVLSIDDFYYTKAERAALAENVHPLLATRGVPGTHDTHMLNVCIEQIQHGRPGDKVALPRFDKSTDDRAAKALWPNVALPVDLLILEGWCVGTRCQTAAELQRPVNALEQNEDADGRWRRYVNEQLRTHYAPLFERLDQLIFLKAPSFAAILRWRLEQEEKLAARSTADAPGLMTSAQIQRFIQFYERLTRVNLDRLPAIADTVFEFDEDHNIRSLG